MPTPTATYSAPLVATATPARRIDSAKASGDTSAERITISPKNAPPISGVSATCAIPPPAPSAMPANVNASVASVPTNAVMNAMP